MKRNMKIFLIRPTEPNRGDMMSRHGLLMRLRNCRNQVVVLSDYSRSFFPRDVIIVKPGILKDLIPSWSQIRLYSRGDEVWWAVGHDLQDDSSSLKLPFLLIKFLFFRLFGLKTKIISQGAGPLTTNMGKLWTRAIMRIVDSASLRDNESLNLVREIAPIAGNKLSLS